MTLTCIIKRKSPQRPSVVLELRGSVDSSTSGKLDEVLGLLLQQDDKRILVDLTGVDYVSSAGWRSFLAAIRKANDRAILFMFAGMQPTVKEVFELLGLERVISAHESIGAAFRALAVTNSEV
jgi:anti-anti-sigma factor